MKLSNIDRLQGQRVFVTGATGFVGRALVSELVNAGANVTALLRSGHGKHRLLGQSVTPVVGSMLDAKFLRENLSKQDAVINLAYDFRVSGKQNLEAFYGLLAAAEASKINRFIQISSIVVYDDWPDNDLTENSPCTPSNSHSYRQVKIEMENRLMGSGVPTIILQPTLVYGPGSAMWTDRPAESLSTGNIILPEPEGVCNIVHIKDLLQAILLASVSEGSQNQRFIISGAEIPRWSDFLGGYAEIIGKGTVRHIPISDLLASLGPEPTEMVSRASPPAAAQISAIARRILGRDNFEAIVRKAKQFRQPKHSDFLPDHHMLKLYSAKGKCNINHARQHLFYAPKYTLQRGLEATKEYLISRYN